MLQLFILVLHFKTHNFSNLFSLPQFLYQVNFLRIYFQAILHNVTEI
jgi:hypothetical protein